MRRALAIVLTLAACQKAAPPPEAKIEAPPDVILTLTLGHGAAFATRLGRYVDAVAPGMGAQVNARVISDAVGKLAGAQLDGIDLEQPVRVIVFNPKTHAQNPVVVLGTFADAEKLTRGAGSLKVERKDGRSLVGAQAEVAAARDWAFGALATAGAPDAPTAEIWIDRVLASYKPELEQFASQVGGMGMNASMQAVLQGEIKAILALGAQSQRLTIALDSTGEEASFEMVLLPRPDTPLARFAGKQKPFDPKLLGEVPVTPGAAMVGVGHVELGDLGEAVYGWFAPLLADMTGRPADEALHKAWTECLAHLTGDFAAVSSVGADGLTMSEIVGADDGPAAQKAFLALIGQLSGPKAVSFMGIGMTFTLTPGAEKHGDASIDAYTVAFDPATVPELQRAMMEKMYPGGMKMAYAGYGKRLAVGFGKDAFARVGQLIDGAAKGSPSPYVQSVIDAAAKRKESTVMVMNMAALVGGMGGGAAESQSGIAVTFGVTDASPRFRMSVPAKHIGEMSAAIRSSGQLPH